MPVNMDCLKDLTLVLGGNKMNIVNEVKFPTF